MHYGLFLLLFGTATTTVRGHFNPNPKALKLSALADDADGWAVEEGFRKSAKLQYEGRPCMTVDRLHKADEDKAYYECAPLSKEELHEFKLTDKEKYLGVWALRSCPANHTFEEDRQKCRDSRVMRRMPLGCDKDPLQIGCGIPCPATNLNPSVGGQCDWITATLIPDRASNAFFLYCAQQTGQTCGEWTRVPCATGTVFDTTTSICVPAVIVQRDSPCGGGGRPICQCAQSGVQNSCPGTASCMANVCCVTPVTVVSVNPVAAPLNQAVAPQSALLDLVHCPGTNLAPLGPCAYCTALCPNSFSAPLGQCNACPGNSICEPSINACCPVLLQPVTPAPPSVSIVLVCPTGQPASSACGTNGACPTGMGCYNGGCCQMSCPVGQTLLGFCGSTGCGQGTCYQDSGCCCQASQAIVLPICQNGVPSIQRCAVDQECPTNQRCSNGGCCPMPFCPTGIQSTARCVGNTGCNAGQSCMDGVCCPLPRCPTGIYALSTCTRSLDCGRPGVECANGGCCPLPQCPNGLVATQRCALTTGCPSGYACLNGACCALPTCPSSGLTAVSSCSLTPCGQGLECISGGCCPLPQCPTGALASQRCQIGVGCSPGNICENGVCCPLPTCSIGIIANGACGMANSCPIGFVCEGRGCCPEPMPLCPNGGRASARCTRGTDCPAGFGCTPLGGCCLLSFEPTCPGAATAVCQCSANSVCPMGAVCNAGMCCSSAAAPIVQVPGSACVASPQCNGFANSCAQCVQGVCVCTGPAASNGVSCIQMTPVQLVAARTGCDQYGSPCNFVLSTARRRPIFAPTGNVTAEPLFYNVAEKRRCVMNSTLIADADSTCLPNEKCIDGECRMKLWPGEYGCQVDEECSARCPNTYCEKRKTEKKVPQCQCRDGLLLHGRCFTKCPEGFHESGAECVHDNEDAFWKSAEAQDRLKALLNNGQC